MWPLGRALGCFDWGVLGYFGVFAVLCPHDRKNNIGLCIGVRVVRSCVHRTAKITLKYIN